MGVDFESVGYLRTKYSFAMVCPKKLGLGVSDQKVKMGEIKGCGVWFWGL